MLYTVPVNEDMLELPSPEALKNKIIIKAKKLNDLPYAETDTESDDDDLNSSEVQSDDTDRTKSSKDSNRLNRKSVKNRVSRIINCRTDSIKEISSSTQDINAKVTSIQEDVEVKPNEEHLIYGQSEISSVMEDGGPIEAKRNEEGNWT